MPSALQHLTCILLPLIFPVRFADALAERLHFFLIGYFIHKDTVN